DCHVTDHVPVCAPLSSGNVPATTPQSPAGAFSSSSTSLLELFTTHLPGRPSIGARSRARSTTARNFTTFPGSYSGRSVSTWTRAGEYSGSSTSSASLPSAVSSSTCTL